MGENSKPTQLETQITPLFEDVFICIYRSIRKKNCARIAYKNWGWSKPQNARGSILYPVCQGVSKPPWLAVPACSRHSQRVQPSHFAVWSRKRRHYLRAPALRRLHLGRTLSLSRGISSRSPSQRRAFRCLLTSCGQGSRDKASCQSLRSRTPCPSCFLM